MHTVPYAPTQQDAADAYTRALLEQLTTGEALHRARIATRRHVRAGVAVDTARKNRDDAIRAAVAAGEPTSRVAQAAGLTPQRVGQIVRGTR